MTKSILILLAIGCCVEMNAQDVIVLKKKGKSIQYFWKGSDITFQLHDKQWLMGVITKITSDSFYLTQEVIRYNMTGIDTLHLGSFSFAYTEVYALPTKKQQVSFENDRVKITEGHEKFVWVRNGFIFQVIGAGYVGLNIANDLINNDPPFAKKNLPGLAIGASLFLLGELLHLHYYPYWHMGKKYKLEYRSLSGPPIREKKSF